MDEIDTVDEALIDADPATVYAAIGDLVRGKAQWWPGVEIRPRGPIGADLVGGVYDEVVRRLPGPSSTLRIVEARPDELIRSDYIDGPILGTGVFTLTPVNGKTRVRYHRRIQPRARLMRLLSRLVPLVYRRFLRAFFDGLRSYVERERPGSTVA